MWKSILILPVVLVLTACETTEQSTLAGAAAGATIGGVASGGNVGATILGGAAGAVAGNLIGRSVTPGDCIYEDTYGNRFVADCPD